MAILWCGGEEIDFAPMPASVTTAGRWRAAYSRQAVYASNPAYSAAFGPVVSAWVSAQVYVYATSLIRILGLVNGATRKGLHFGFDSGGSNLAKGAVYKHDGSTYTLLASETGSSFVADSITKLDMQITSYGPTGNIKVYANGALIIDFTGDLSVAGVTNLDRFVVQGYVSSISNTPLSEIIVADEDTRLFSLKTLIPNAAGDANSFTSGGYTEIDELALSDADTMYSATPGQAVQVGLTGMPTGDFVVKAVKLAARVADGVGGMGMKMGVKTNAAIHLGAAVTLDASWRSIEALQHTNPATGNRYTPAEIEALQLAFESTAA